MLLPRPVYFCHVLSPKVGDDPLWAGGVDEAFLKCSHPTPIKQGKTIHKGLGQLTKIEYRPWIR